MGTTLPSSIWGATVSTAVRVGVLTAVVVTLLAGSVQAVTGHGGKSGAALLAAKVGTGPRGYGVPDGYASGYAGHAAGADWVLDTRDKFSIVFGAGFTEGAADSDGGPGLDSGVGYLDAFTIACRDGDLVGMEIWPDTASYDGSPLSSADITSTSPLHGFEYRIPGCDDPNWDAEVDTQVGPFPASSIQLTILGQGDNTPYADTFHESGFPDCVLAGAAAGFDRAGAGS
ncbi:MAG: hypothetical protein QOJ29_2611 [Thermoleophilaceae bacterium]|nr:hypothetical protein [Thermoleophilaceae bacterium]